MTAPIDDARTVIAEEWAAAARLVDALTGTDLDRPTRCDGWSVRDLVRHLLWGSSMEAEALERAVAGDRTPAAGTIPHHDAPASAARTLVATRTRLLDAFDAAGRAAAGREVLVPLAAATLPFTALPTILVMEAGVHTDDLRHAVSGRSALRPEVTAAALGFLVPFLPTAAAGAGERPDGPMTIELRGDTVAVDHRFDGDAWHVAESVVAGDPVVRVEGTDELLALLLLGRLAATDDRLRWTGTDDPAALKRWLPGP